MSNNLLCAALYLHILTCITVLFYIWYRILDIKNKYYKIGKLPIINIKNANISEEELNKIIEKFKRQPKRGTIL